MTNDLSTLICLFHHTDQANAALQDILKAGIPESNVTLIGGPGSQIEASRASLAELNVPQKDLAHLLEGLSHGGALLTVSAISDHAEKVEAIFRDHKAGKIDEAVVDDDMSGSATPFDTGTSTLSTETLEEDAVLVPESYNQRTGTTVYRVLPVSSVDSLDADVDPRELGLDARLAPTKTEVL